MENQENKKGSLMNRLKTQYAFFLDNLRKHVENYFFSHFLFIFNHSI